MREFVCVYVIMRKCASVGKNVRDLRRRAGATLAETYEKSQRLYGNQVATVAKR